MRRGFTEKADAHMAIAERLLHGPPKSPAVVTSKRRRTAPAPAKDRSENMAG
jgi:hypothetical protein